ncbi:MAG: phenylalanine--tRNA ligase subunit alpha [Candidatus Nanoarchaeia archaeon]|nr:phenylalanine--tRNA ligase subunit alpha [Candidatus Nanoarchaeia archaeon]
MIFQHNINNKNNNIVVRTIMEIGSLHIIERKIIKALGKLGKADVNAVSKETGLNDSQTRRGVEWLRNKEIAEVSQHTKEFVKLEKNGFRYAKEGMPEKRFINSLVRPLMLNEIREKVKLDKDELNYCIGNLKKKAYISFEQGKIKLTSLAKNFSESPDANKEFLNLLSKGEISTENLNEEQKSMIKNLKERRDILSVEIKTERIYSLSKKGVGILSELKDDAEDSIGKLTSEMLSSKSWKNKKFRSYDINAEPPKIMTGKKHPYKSFQEGLRSKLAELGFKEMTGPIVEHSFYNCEALFMPQDHPAKGIHDLYYIKNPKKQGSLSSINKTLQNVKKMHEEKWKYRFSEAESEKLVLRSQGTALSARMLMDKNLEMPGKYFAVSKVYRPDITDWKHLSEFYQVEGIVVDYNLTLRDLFGMLKLFAEEVAHAEKYKIVPGYFPFTEPSAELHCFVNGKWVEMGGSGIFRPELTKPLGIDATVIAWGLGIDRQFMSKKGIKDIRDVYSSNIDWLRKTDVIV